MCNCINSLSLIATIFVLTLTMFALYFSVEYIYREASINRLLYLLNLFATSVIFFREILLLVLLNYNIVSDSVPSYDFLIRKIMLYFD